jgi:LDH2 family malate/lactate/ureidoglycolate dehydrogenase
MATMSEVEVINGLILPVGGYQGTGLAVMVEVP